MLNEEPHLLADYATSLFPVFVQVHSAAANAGVRQKCLSCISKTIHFHSADGLEELLRELPFASFIASLFSSHETPQQGLAALGIAETLYEKMPHIYADRFLREGVFHAVSALAAAADDVAMAAAAAPAATTASSSSAAAVTAATAAPRRLSRSSSGGAAEAATAAAASGAAAAAATGSRTRAGGRSGDPAPAVAPSAPTSAAAAAMPKAADSATATLMARAVKFRDVFVASDAALANSLATGHGSPTLVKLRSLAGRMCDTNLYSTLNPNVTLGAAPLLAHVDVAALRELAVLLTERDGISTFEFAQSGLVDAILKYLIADADADLGSAESAAGAGTERRAFRLRAFCHLFLGTAPPTPPAVSVDSPGKKSTRSAARTTSLPAPPPLAPDAAAAAASAGVGGALFRQLLGKLQDAINMIEAFPLLLTEGTSSDTSSAGLKALTQPFKLRLQRAPGTSLALKEYASNVVLIEPLASVAAIEDFLWPKVRRDVSLRQVLRDSVAPPAAAAAADVSSVAAAAAVVSGSSAAAAASSSAASSSGSGGASGSAGKLPVRGDDGAASSQASKSRGGEEGLFRADEDDAEMGGEEEEDDDDEDDDEDEGDDEMFSSAGLATSLDSNAECVHDLELSSPPRGTGKAAPSLSLPGADASSSASAARKASGRAAAAAAAVSAGASSSSGSGAAATATAVSSRSARGGTAAAAAGPAAAAAVPADADADAAASGSGEGSAPTTIAGADGRTHHLALLLNGHMLPFSMTIFQAIRHYGSLPPAVPSASQGGEEEGAAGSGGPSGEGGGETVAPRPPVPPSSIGQRMWGDVYSISYQPLKPEDATRLNAGEMDESPVPMPEGSAAGRDDAAAGWSLRVLPHEVEPLLARLASEPPALAAEGGVVAPLLRLLWTLIQLSAHAASLDGNVDSSAAPPAAPASAFLNRKLNAKLLRQLADPLALCSRSLPSWCSSLATGCPGLFAFEARRLFLVSTAFGLSRALQRLQQHTQEGATSAPNGSSERSDRLGRLPRQKVRISRARVMDSALKVMDLYAGQKALLEVEYFQEVGTGLGPTLEFYTLVSRELRRSELRLWIDDGPPPGTTPSGDDAAYVYSACGLYPRAVAQSADGAGVPARTLQLFTFMGKFVAKAMLDNRLVDLPFCTTFYRQLLGAQLSLHDLAEVNPSLAGTLKRLQNLAHSRAALLKAGKKPGDAAFASLTLDGADVADLGLDFTLPGQPEVELSPGGASRDVTLDNVGEYVQRVLDVSLAEGVKAQVGAFRAGFSAVFPIERLSAFASDELDVLLNGSRERWEASTIIEFLKFDHGYTRNSRAVGFLLEVICEFSSSDVSTFLKFVTGSPRLPVGGLARLSPRLTIVMKRPEEGISPDAYLPSVMTCANYVKLPDYSSKDIMRERLLTAIHEGQGAFYLS